MIIICLLTYFRCRGKKKHFSTSLPFAISNLLSPFQTSFRHFKLPFVILIFFCHFNQTFFRHFKFLFQISFQTPFIILISFCHFNFLSLNFVSPFQIFSYFIIMFFTFFTSFYNNFFSYFVITVFYLLRLF